MLLRICLLCLLALVACGGTSSQAPASVEPHADQPDGPEATEPEVEADAGVEADTAALVGVDPEPVATGSLSKDAIQGVIRPRRSEFRYCYEKELIRDPKLAGRLDVGFTIGSDGSVIETKTEGFPNEKVAECVAAVMRSMKFPAPKGGGVVVVSYPFVFRSAE